MNLLKKSTEVIKSLQLRNGAILATPVSGPYPYVYPRDAVIMTKALNRVGLSKDSERFYRFVKDLCRVEHYGEVFHRYNSNGLPAVTRNHQHDNTSLLIHGIYDTYLHGGRKEFLVEMWPIVEISVRHILSFWSEGLVETDSSIHENDVLESGFDIWANSAACRALYDAVEIGKILKCYDAKKGWEEKADILKSNIKKKFFDSSKGVYRKNLRHKDILDISQLAPFYFGIENSNKILRKTLSILREGLWDSTLKGFRRFRRLEVVKDWHWYTGGSGTWLALTLVAARFYKKINHKRRLQECMEFVDFVAKRNSGLLPEHIAIKEEYDLWRDKEIEFNSRIVSGMKQVEKNYRILNKKYKENIVYWALPLGWAHAEYVLLMKK